MTAEPTASDATLDVVIGLVAERVRPVGAQRPDTGAALADLGLTSLDIVALIVAVERECAVSFPASMLNREVFHSAGTVAAAVDALREQHPEVRAHG